MDYTRFARLITKAELIKEETEKDVLRFEGALFKGRNTAEYFGCHSAAIVALSDIIIEMLKDIK